MRIKHWGFWAITRRRYLANQAVVFVAWVFLVAVNGSLPHPLPAPPPKAHALAHGLFIVVRQIPWVLIAVAVWWPIDVLVTLRCFALAAKRRQDVKG